MMLIANHFLGVGQQCPRLLHRLVQIAAPYATTLAVHVAGDAARRGPSDQHSRPYRHVGERTNFTFASKALNLIAASAKDQMPFFMRLALLPPVRRRSLERRSSLFAKSRGGIDWRLGALRFKACGPIAADVLRTRISVL
jgi:hypothetical protein